MATLNTIKAAEYDKAITTGRTMRPDDVLKIEADMVRRILEDGRSVGRDMSEQMVNAALMISDSVYVLCSATRNSNSQYATWLYEFVLAEALDTEHRPLRWHAMNSLECKRYALYHFRRAGVDGEVA